MNQNPLPPQQQIMQFILGKWISKPIYVAAKLGIADLISTEPKSMQELAGLTETKTEMLYRLLRALAGVGIFAELENGQFANTPMSECLMEGRLKTSALLFHSAWHDAIWDNLLYSIQTGEPAFENVHGDSAFSWFENHPNEAKIFHDANSFKAASTHRIVADVYDFSSVKSITDVAGGTGGLLIEILKKYPHLNGIIADLPHVVQIAMQNIQEHNIENRLKTVECDFFNEIPPGSDVLLLSNILHDWLDEDCITILKNCRDVLDSDGKLLIIESIIPQGNTFSISKLLDLEVLLMGGGKERTEKEYKILLEQSGFSISNVLPTRENISIIEAEPSN